MLIVTDEMEVGGSQRQIVNLASGLARAGHRVTVAYFCHRSFFVEELEQAGVPVVALDKRGRFDPSFLRRLLVLIGSARFDVVHAFAFSAECWTAAALACMPRGRRPPLVTSIRGTYDWYGAWQWRIKRWVSARSARVVANSMAGAAAAGHHLRLKAAELTVIYNGVAEPTLRAGARELTRQTLGLGVQDLLVLYAGRLVDVKDVGTLLKAFSQGCAEPAQLLVSGDGPLREALEAQAGSLGIGRRARFLGERDDVEALMSAADILVLPSRHEGLSNVILEGMRGGLPVVASRTGGNVELVEPGATGLLFEVGDAGGLAAALSTLAADPPLRQRLGRAGAARVRENFTIDAMVGAFAELYRRAAAGPAAPWPIANERVADGAN